MNIYDTANKLAQEIKQSQEYTNYKKAKENIKSKSELQEKIQEFEKMRYEVQISAVTTGKRDEQQEIKMQNLYAELIKSEEVKDYFEAETKFNIVIADVNKIIGEAIKDVIQ